MYICLIISKAQYEMWRQEFLEKLILTHNDFERNFVKGGKLVSQSVVGQLTGICEINIIFEHKSDSICFEKPQRAFLYGLLSIYNYRTAR